MIDIYEDRILAIEYFTDKEKGNKLVFSGLTKEFHKKHEILNTIIDALTVELKMITDAELRT